MVVSPIAHKGRKHTPEECRKISEANKGQGLGRKLPLEVRQKMSKSLLGKIPWNKGRKSTPEECRKMSEIVRKSVTDETRKKISLVHKGKPKSLETRRKMSEARKKQSPPMLGKKHTEEAKKKMSDAKCGWVMSPESRKRLSESKMGNIPWNKGIPFPEEVRKKISDSLKGISPKNKGKPMSEEQKQKLSKIRFKYGKKIAGMVFRSKRKSMGYNYLNLHFENSNGHHIDKDTVVFIPHILHKFFHHNHHKPKSMYNINLMTIYWLIYTHQINFDNNYTEQELLPRSFDQSDIYKSTSITQSLSLSQHKLCLNVMIV